ncbi:MAG: hypothetical protein IMZ44_04535, partial [Planctomycetes bacterium]|nr:hypothetical protein [Planctomycetota bacterium]
MSGESDISRRQFLRDGTGAVAGAVSIAALRGEASGPGDQPAGGETGFRSPAGSPIPFNAADLTASGPARSFSGAQSREIAFPLGGIGTGTVSLGGRGELRDWEIFNRPNKGRVLPATFVALRVQRGSDPPILRVVAAEPGPPYTGSSGAPRDSAQGLPHLEAARFTGTYPIAEVIFTDGTLPLEVALEAYNPLIPLQVDDSSLPVAVFRYRLRNTSADVLDATLAFTMLNPIGYDGRSAIVYDRFEGFGQNLTRFRRESALAGIEMASAKYPPDHVRHGTIALVTHRPEPSARCAWQAGRRDEGFRDWLDQFVETGSVGDRQPPSPSQDGYTCISTLASRVRLAPGETCDIPYVLAWHFPTRENYWDKDPAVLGQRFRNDYATRFPDAWAVARHTVTNLSRLEQGTRTFRDALAGSTLPVSIVDAVSSQVSTLRTNTCLLLEGKQFFAFEGTYDDAGCCPMNCTHVWNYEQALAHLFPDLERSMRVTDFTVNLKPDGAMAFRTLVPTGKAVWQFKPAADGQLGCILKLYREWQLSGDEGFLRRLWPAAKR